MSGNYYVNEDCIVAVSLSKSGSVRQILIKVQSPYCNIFNMVFVLAKACFFYSINAYTKQGLIIKILLLFFNVICSKF